MNLNHQLDRIIVERSSHPALMHPGGEVSYETFGEAVRRLARGLHRQGIQRGDRVALMLPNVPQFAISYYAILRLGAVAVPVNMALKPREVIAILEDSEAMALIAWRGVWDQLRDGTDALTCLRHIILLGDDLPGDAQDLTRLIAVNKPMSEVADLEENDPAVVQYTAGTTGQPRGAELTHNNLLSNVNACAEVLKVSERDRLLAALPFFHPLGQTLIMNMGLLTGGGLVLQPMVSAEQMSAALLDGSVTLFAGVPSMFKMMLEAAGLGDESQETTQSSVRLCICGGGSIGEELLKAFEKRFGTYILECYTLSEASPVTSFNQWRTGRRVGSLGHPLPGVEMKVIDSSGNEASIGEVGRIIIKGPNVMKRYINRPRLSEETLQKGWLYTGDLGKMDINGFFYLVERERNRIVKAGFSVYPAEIEAVLNNHPEVREAAVVGIADLEVGEETKACVVLKEGATVSTEQLADYCRENLAIYKVPTMIRFYKDLARTSTGRIDREALKG